MSDVLGQTLGNDSSSLGDAGDDFNFTQYSESNIGEGKRWASADEALAALAKKAVHQDTFIETLKLEKQGVEKEREKLVEQLGSSDKLDELYKVLTETPGAAEGVKPVTQEAAAVSKDDISSTVQELLDARTQAETEKQRLKKLQDNQDKAFSLLSKSADEGGFGSVEDAKLAIKMYVGDSDERKHILNELGAHQPEAVAAFLKGQVSLDKLGGTSESARATGSSEATGKGGLTWNEVQRIKKDNPELYKSRKFQVSIHRAAAENPNFWN